MKKKMIQVDAIVHTMLKSMASANGLTLSAYVMKIAYEEQARETKKNNNN